MSGVVFDTPGPSGAQIRLENAPQYTDLTVNSSGDLTIAPSGGDLTLTAAVSITSALAVAGSLSVVGAASLGSLAVGVAVAGSPVHIARGAISLPSLAGNYLTLGGSENNVGTLRLIGFGYTGGGALHAATYIGQVETSIAGFTLGDLVFGTRSVTTDTAPSERMRITSGGFVLIGTTDTTGLAAGGLKAAGASIFSSSVQIVGNVGFNGSAPVAKGTITGSRGGNAAVASLITYLASRGDITDSTTA